MKTLEIDMGNSRLKWRLRGSSSHSRGCPAVAVANAEAYDYSKVFEGIGGAPDQVLVASVVPALKQHFTDWCCTCWGREPIYAVVTEVCAGVRNAYRDVSQMGVDRWLAMLAAYAQCQSSCLVIDMGTAPTVDLVRFGGEHIGGYITPGLNLMNRALLNDTGIRENKSDDIPPIVYGEQVQAGRSTGEAIQFGLTRMHLGLILGALDELQNADKAKPHLVFSGGGGREMAALFEQYLRDNRQYHMIGSLVFRSDLILDGLSLLDVPIRK